jgi:hypothetical protein
MASDFSLRAETSIVFCDDAIKSLVTNSDCSASREQNKKPLLRTSISGYICEAVAEEKKRYINGLMGQMAAISLRFGPNASFACHSDLKKI